MSTFNPNEIWGFLGTYGGEQYSRGAWPSYADPAAAPGQAPLYDDESIAGGSDVSWKQSNYTTVSTSTSQAYTNPASVFSQPRTTAESQSSAPSRGAPHVPFDQQFAVGTAPGAAAHTYVLWCEFCDLKGCDATFRGDDEAGWIQHHVHHLKDRFPAELMCWFCDDHVSFVAANKADRPHNFVLRMEHIREHIGGDYLTLLQMRPDFHMLEHLRKHNLIDGETYRHAKKYSELPPSLRLPGSNSESDAFLNPQSQSRPEVGQYYNLEKEERHRKRHQQNANGRNANGRNANGKRR